MTWVENIWGPKTCKSSRQCLHCSEVARTHHSFDSTFKARTAPSEPVTCPETRYGKRLANKDTLW